MARPTSGRPTDQELEILKVLWEQGPSSVRDVWKVIAASRDIGCTSVLKIMQKEAPNLFSDYALVPLADGTCEATTTHRKV